MSSIGEAATPMPGAFDEDEALFNKKRYQDIDDRRFKEWENHQKAHRSTNDPSVCLAYMDIVIGDTPAGRLTFELFESMVPQTVDNFRNLLCGATIADRDTLARLDYIDSAVYRIDGAKKIVCIGELNGFSVPSGGSGFLPDENFTVRHSQRGVLSMITRGPNTVGSSFAITLDSAAHLDFKQVAFGRIIDGMGVLTKIEQVPVNRIGTPSVPIVISFCGVLSGSKNPQSLVPNMDLGSSETPTAAAAELSASQQKEFAQSVNLALNV
jgi:peptidylprolyl isomerase